MRDNGQSLIELIIILPIFIGFWAAMLWFSQALIISLELLHTAHYGIFRLVYQTEPIAKRHEAERVQKECRDFLREQRPRLALDQVRITVEPGDTWKPIGPESLKDVIQFINFAKTLDRQVKSAAGLLRFQPARVRVEYDLPVPRLLRAIPGFPDHLPLRGYSVCYR